MVRRPHYARELLEFQGDSSPQFCSCYNAVVKTPDMLICDKCDHAALVVFTPGHRAGVPQLVARLSFREDGVYVAIACPNCGQREQYLAPQPNPSKTILAITLKSIAHADGLTNFVAGSDSVSFWKLSRSCAATGLFSRLTLTVFRLPHRNRL